MKKLILFFVLALFLFSCEMKQDNRTAATDDNWKLDRTVLPIKEPPPPVFTELDVRNTKPPKIFKVEAPEDAPIPQTLTS